VANFGNTNGGGGDGDLDSTFLREFMGVGAPEATYTGFCDIYSLLAVFEDFDSISNKGETLRELDMIKKSGIKHAAEATVIYSLKKIVPGIFREGLTKSGASYLSALPTAEHWDSIFSTNPDVKPGLKQVLEERIEECETQICGVIADAYNHRGLDKVAELAKDMLTKSVKALHLVVTELSRVYRNLTVRSDRQV
jgi:hypothetical protein